MTPPVSRTSFTFLHTVHVLAAYVVDMGAPQPSSMPSPDAAPTVDAMPVLSRRERTFQATQTEIRSVARQQIAQQGTAALTMRAIGRELGMTASALYRYYDGRDALLTALIIESFDALGEHVEAAAAELADDTEAGEASLRVTHALRRWAVDRPQEWALLYGSPVPGYQAPEDTLVHQLRTTNVLLDILVRAVSSGQATVPGAEPGTLAPELDAAMALLCEYDKWSGLQPAQITAALACWCTLLGAIGAEVFGHLPPGPEQAPAAFFDYTMRGALAAVGFDERAVRPAVL